MSDTINIHLAPGKGSSLNLAKPVSFFTTFSATVVKDLRIALRYRANFIGNLIGLLLRMALFLVLSNAVIIRDAGENMGPEQLFIFFQGALILFAFKGTALNTPLNSVSQDLYNGTLEFIYSNPCSRYSYYLGSVFSTVFINLPVILPLYAVLVYFAKAPLVNMLMVLAVCVVVFITLTAFGVMIGMLGLLWRQIHSIAGIIDIAFEFLAGAYFPLSMFPEVLRYAAYALPFTWGYDLIRYYSLGEKWNTLLPVWSEWAVLAASAVVFTFISRILLKQVEQLARKNGLHLI